MRTTIAIDDDVLTAAKAIARQRRQNVGKVVSELVRNALRLEASGQRNSVPLLPICEPRVIGHTENRQRATRRDLVTFLIDINMLIASSDPS